MIMSLTHCGAGGRSRFLVLFDPIKPQGGWERAMQRCNEREGDRPFPVGKIMLSGLL